ncbi:tRNA-modifying protein YgfZ [Thorsellia anophelis]|uniref:tRNA-modifying protein YgfZ-like beta-barrel domain-containing protein n=1 Tax=Thorsellia anophelis DSM 18579 TaxID=1123402 RepID=A0A1I0DNA3_9GAMM|nr:tRNA-modifying protein YgfZ [Thorsellia anophelis]SET33822.1 hypothetical protein SAMN02583745_02044 [Thorsellia anophelis DSM 18579]
MNLNICNLDDYKLIQVSGLEAKKYLQGQLTLDMDNLATDRHYLTAHCDPKGKVYAVLRIWQIREDVFYYLIPSNLLEKQLTELKKYAVFSKVSFTVMDDILLNALLFNDKASIEQFILKNNLKSLLEKDISHNLSRSILINLEHNTTYLILEDELTIISITGNKQDPLINTENQSVFKRVNVPSSYWYSKLIIRGEPLITNETTQQFIPQALNLQSLDAISFTKGCYTGQEMVARAKYRGANKRALYSLIGKGKISNLEIGSSVEIQLEDNWRETGAILAYSQIEEEVYLQVVMSNSIQKETLFRLPNQPQIIFSILPLPYEIEI